MKPKHERTRITDPDNYWAPHPGQPDFPDEPVPPKPKRPIGSGKTEIPGPEDLPAEEPGGEGAMIPDPSDDY